MLETMERPSFDAHKLAHMYPNAHPDAIDLMQKLLVFNPKKRLTAEEALNHPFVRDFHNPQDEPSAKQPITIPIDDNKKVRGCVCVLGSKFAVLPDKVRWQLPCWID